MAMSHASPEPHDDYASGAESPIDENGVKTESGQASPSGLGAQDAPAVKAPGHMQKRRRVTRACDECRRKKIKCDGKQPCTHCTVYSYDCSYDQPSNRRRNPAPAYVENLEHRVHRAETLLHILIPNLDLNDPGIELAVQQGWIPGAPGKGNPTAAVHEARASRPAPAPASTLPSDTGEKKPDTNLESMVRAIAQLDMDETGHWDYHGHSSGLSFVRRMREQLGDLMGPETFATPFVKNRPMSQVFDSPRSIVESPMGEIASISTELPPKEMARQLSVYAINDAAALLRMVHHPTYWESFERLYATPSDNYSNEDNRFLPLFYSAIALGSLFGKDDETVVDRDGYESAIQQGFTYFKTARQLMDIADCRDLASIQAVIFMILFLQSSAKMSQCYAYVGVALRSALRLGLHRAAAGRFDPVEAETRKRVFWIIRKMDIYVGAMLGLPQTLSDEDIDQEFPVEVDDEYITKDGILAQPEGVVPIMTAFNAHTRLVQILQKIVRKIYPIKFAETESVADKSYSVSFSTIREIESELEEWKKSLPQILTPCEAPPRYARVQQLLRLSYSHAQVLLYRPFLHYTAMERRSKPVDQRAYACAASFVNVSRNIIHIASQMKQKGLLNGAFWFIMYTTFFSILALVYFAAENPDNPTTAAVMKDAIEGRDVLASLSSRSMAADRCTATLNIVFERLPAWLRNGQQNPAMSKKRAYEQGPYQQGPAASRSHPDVSSPTALDVKRATFPNMSGNGSTPGAASPYEASWSQSVGSSYGPQTPTSASFDPNAYPAMGNRSISHPVDSGMQQYPMPQNFANPQLSELSSMMFPTADEPFIYPNQPLTTFENNQQFAKNAAYLNRQAFGNMGKSSPVGSARDPAENIEAQFYTLPPYLEQQRQQHQPPVHNIPSFGGRGYLPHQQHQQQQTTRSALPFTNGTPTGATATLAQVPNGQWQQPPLSNIDIQGLFGGAESTWNPMNMNMMPNYQNQQ
ncbi:hypothetical protein CKM354_000338100 [Cercospora kikuchii]|uniref:Zn(2)-C6 fungal-type domain-containing protein n=1 Tax=Cercospora kikuchii TaxID=84275 RepID=A0A9P3CGI8_9PEZI|nr:uncharacterized protein CKM354_000338100 [Cercospora kikuchii]GIZ40025.1 hypothetical protein CKM354_000338100 [Cercospora kikuchii]